MSKEYIEREAALKIIYDKWFTTCSRISNSIRELPAVDVEPVRHGEWTHKNGEMYCSICGDEALMDEVYYESPYCPNCGAKMDGGNK